MRCGATRDWNEVRAALHVRVATIASGKDPGKLGPFDQLLSPVSGTALAFRFGHISILRLLNSKMHECVTMSRAG